MSFKIAFIGAGSVGFTRQLIADLMGVPEFEKVELCLMDIQAHNLEMVAQLCQKDIDHNGLGQVKLWTTMDQREAVRNARYVFSVVRIGGLEAFQHDIDIPLKYGIDQCVGDTLCAGGVMYGQRGIPMMLNLCKDIREMAEPQCLLMNYANPMAMITWACNAFGGVRTLGLCHGVQGGHGQIAKALGLEKKEVDIICAGINHQTWYIQIKAKGELVSKEALLKAFEDNEELSKTEKVRIDMLKRFGAYSTESNGHLSEYLAWYRKRPEEITRWIDTGTWINGETGGYLRVCTEGRTWFETDFPNWMKGDAKAFGTEHRSEEHGSYIVESLETGRLYRGHFNVVNNGTITNLPDDAIVEVPGYIDANGINIPKVGDLPLGCAAVCNASISVQRLSVHAAIKGDIELLRQAILMDPLSGAVCNPPEIWQLVDEMLVAGEPWLPQYHEAIEAAKMRLKSETLIPARDYQGAARISTKSIEEMQKNANESRKNAMEADKAKNRPAATV